MALEGSLRDFDLFSLFNMIKTQGKSGTLVLSRGQEFVKVFFDQGEIVGCDSNQVRVEERLGTMLVRLGRLSGDELLALLQQQRQTLKRMGTLLLESGRVSAQDLQDALFNQAMSIIYRTFRWVEGDYRFDSILPMDLDRENFPAIPVDTVLMEAARIMDEWPEVQRRLPDHRVPLVKTTAARGLSLDIDRELSGILEGRASAPASGSGLNHEQETVLTYFSEPQSIQSILQITRYEELETCKIIAELMEAGLLEAAPQESGRPSPAWTTPAQATEEVREPARPSTLLYPLAALAILAPCFTAWVPKDRASWNQGLASLQPADVRIVVAPFTRARKAWALRLAEPADGGLRLGAALGSPLETEGAAGNPIPDFSRLPDPLRIQIAPPPPLPASPAEAAQPAGVAPDSSPASESH